MNPEIPNLKKENVSSVMEITTSEDVSDLIKKFLLREFAGEVKVTMDAYAGGKTEHWDEFEYPRCIRVSFPANLKKAVVDCLENYKKIYNTNIDAKEITND